ncbi:MAG TPA: DUF305 domain-containing protein [Miltoncostaeales bacterium]|nr:DUF305 domain-containing protein [Miltoncostaeales bacterium]
MTVRRALSVVMLVTVAGAVALGCGGGDSAGTTQSSDTFNDADVTFAQGMIPHHEQAIEMADIALDPQVGASEAVTTLATQIKAAQDPEIVTMTAWLKAWGKPMMGSDHSGHDMGGMLSSQQMSDLDDARGTAFDRMFYELMIKHHDGAIAMATTVQKDGTNAEVRALATQVITGQTAEIEAMKRALG